MRLPVTATFDTKLKNLKGNTHFPRTLTRSPCINPTEVVLRSRPSGPNAPWKYSYTYSSIMGSATASHDDSCVYSLPYTSGSSYSVSQGYHGQLQPSRR